MCIFFGGHLVKVIDPDIYVCLAQTLIDKSRIIGVEQSWWAAAVAIIHPM